nr:adenylyl-sulfate kinase [Stutzerimonas nitrititolerans]
MKTPDPILAEDLISILDVPLPWEQLYGRNVLVTGASGFIGGHIVEALAWLNRCHPKANLRIHAMARDLEKLRQRLPWLDLSGEVTPLIQDVTQPCGSDTLPDIIIHAASPASPRDYLERPVDTVLANASGTQQLLELARRKQARFLFLSSGAVYGDNSLQIDAIGETDFGGEDPLTPRACYSESKRLAETLCQAYHVQYGLDIRIARISHCYGPGMRLDDGRAIADLLADVLADRDIRLDSDGSASRPFCYISDTVLGLFHILLAGEPGNAYNLGETRETTILELAEKMIAAAGKSGRLSVRAQARSGLAPAARSAGHFDIGKIKRLGWSPRVDLDTGLVRTLASHGAPAQVSALLDGSPAQTAFPAGNGSSSGHDAETISPSAACSSGQVFWQQGAVDRSAREELARQQGVTLWLTGLSASGKSTTAYALERQLIEAGRLCCVLDGDNLRHGINRNLGFTHEDRTENIRRTAEIARLMNDAGLIVIASLISPLITDRGMAGEIIGTGRFVEIYLNTPLEVCEARDPKKLYSKARQGLITHFTGISAPYEAPLSADICINTAQFSPVEAAQLILSKTKLHLDVQSGKGN